MYGSAPISVYIYTYVHMCLCVCMNRHVYIACVACVHMRVCVMFFLTTLVDNSQMIRFIAHHVSVQLKSFIVKAKNGKSREQ